MTKGNVYHQRKKTLEQRFDEKIDKTSDCWLWTSAIGSRGYGIFWVGGEHRSKFAHRVSWELANGAEIPPGLVVMHSCDNPRCVNPAHLSLGTSQENADDASQKGRTARGERNRGGGKLTEAQAREIKSRAMSIAKAAAAYGISTQTVKAIRKGRIWRHVDL